MIESRHTMISNSGKNNAGISSSLRYNFFMMFKKVKKEIIYCVSLLILACILVVDLWLFSTQPQTFDGWAHLVTFDSFAQSMQAGSLPVSWTDSVAHYGYPLGQIAHQTTNYLGGALFMLVGNVVTAYNITLSFILIVTSLLMYRLLRFFVGPLAAFAGSALFMIAPYRFLNTYVRGALPELMSSVFIITVIIGFGYYFKSSRQVGFFISGLGICGLALTHPMMLLLSFPILLAFFIYFILSNKISFKKYTAMTLFLLFGLMISGYYIIPLIGEIKYFYQGATQSEISQGQFMKLDVFYLERWEYADSSTAGIRENRFQFGVLEFIIMLVGISLYFFKKKVFADSTLASTLIVTFFCISILLFDVSKVIYDVTPFLSSIQFPWRWLGILTLIPPFIFALYLEKMPFKKTMLIFVLIWIAVFRIPEAYGKNYTSYPPERYSTTSVNIHSTIMNTIWSGVTTEYPEKTEQAAIITGQGNMTLEEYSPTRRKYLVSADEPIRIAEYTFYFPGWKVFVNGQEYPIEFQDHEYRGVITYELSQPGEHEVDVVYTDTNMRLLGKLISVIGLVLLISSASLLRWKPRILE